MKMHSMDYRALQAAIEKRFSAPERIAIYSRYVARGLSAKRFRWDMLHASGFNITALYNNGLNNSHIDTALRSIIPIRETNMVEKINE